MIRQELIQPENLFFIRVLKCRLAQSVSAQSKTLIDAIINFLLMVMPKKVKEQYNERNI